MRKYIILLIVPFLAACEMTVPVDLPDQEPKLVMNSMITPGSEWEVQMSKSRIISDDDQTFNKVENATVQAFDGDVLLGNFTYEPTKQAYFANINIVPGKTYTLRASAPGLDPVEAQQMIPQALKIDSTVFLKNVRTNKEGLKESDLKIYFSDSEGVENFYGLKISHNDTTNMIGGYFCFRTLDPALQENSFSFGDDGSSTICGTSIFQDALFDGKKYEVIVSIDEYMLQMNIDLRVELLSLSRDYYLYRRSLFMQQMSEGNPFAEPVVVRSNVENGFGIFAGYSKSQIIVSY